MDAFDETNEFETESEIICAQNREYSDPLCSRCADGYFELFGTTACGRCVDWMYALWLIPINIAAICSVAFLLFDSKPPDPSTYSGKEVNFAKLVYF